jgi:hypothetical protein
MRRGDWARGEGRQGERRGLTWRGERIKIYQNDFYKARQDIGSDGFLLLRERIWEIVRRTLTSITKDPVFYRIVLPTCRRFESTHIGLDF